MKRALAAVALSLATLSCSRSHSPEAATTAVTEATAPTSPPSTKGESIYQLDMKLTDQDGSAVPLDVFRGHPTVVTMFYGTCPAACPALVHDVKKLEGRIDPAARGDVRVLLVSFDTKRDTPEVLMKMAKKHEVDLARWKMAAAPSEDAARELAAVLGFQFRRLESGEFSHSSRMSLVDANGVIVAQADGLGQASSELLPEIKRHAVAKR